MLKATSDAKHVKYLSNGTVIHALAVTGDCAYHRGAVQPKIGLKEYKWRLEKK